MKNYHILKIKYFGPTNTNPSRVHIISDRFEQRVIIPYDHRFNSTVDIAIHWLTLEGYVIIGKGEGKDCYYVISETFEPLRK